MNFQKTWDQAAGKKAKIDALEQKALRLKLSRDAAIKKLHAMVRPHCDAAVKAFNDSNKNQIRLNDKNGLIFAGSNENKILDLAVGLFDAQGAELNEWFDSTAQVEAEFTSRLRLIIQPIFDEHDIPLTLGKLRVPESYSTE